MRLAAGATRPTLPELAPFVVHEIHRVPLAQREAYLAFMTRKGRGLLKASGFRPAGLGSSKSAGGPRSLIFSRTRAWPSASRRSPSFSANPDGRTLSTQARRIDRGCHQRGC